MERKKKPIGVEPVDTTDPTGELIRWRKKGGGTFRLTSGKIIKPNQVFSARMDEIPELVRKQFVEQLTGDPDSGPVKVAEANYTLRVKSPGWFDIVDSSGKKMNERAMRQVDARKMIEGLTGKKPEEIEEELEQEKKEVELELAGANDNPTDPLEGMTEEGEQDEPVEGA
jgi:hypothetical protein